MTQEGPDGALTRPITPMPVGDGPVELRITVDHAAQQFYWRQYGYWLALGPVLDASVISAEGGRGEHGSIAGAFVGMVAFDITGEGREARFARFSYDPT